VRAVAGLGHAQIADRLENPDKFDRVDLLTRLMQGRNADGSPLKRGELTAEALTQLVAGSDTMSISVCAFLFHVMSNQRVLSKLRKELDDALPDSSAMPTFAAVKDLP
jgi:benzoate 4-monooxygenase